MSVAFDPWAALEKLKSTSTPANSANSANFPHSTGAQGAELAVLAKLAGRPPRFDIPANHTLTVPDEWTEGLIKLRSMPCPRGIQADRWRRAVTDVTDFISVWGSAAHGLGWPTLLLFGVDRYSPEQRLDGAGLCWLLNGDRVVAVMADKIALRGSRTKVRHFYRQPTSITTVPVWSGGGPKLHGG